MSASKENSQNNNDGNMTLSGHLKELRNRLVVIVLCLVVTFFVGLNFAPRIVDILTGMGSVFGYEFVTLEPAELLLQYFTVALLSAIILTFPVILYHVWAFIQPGLRENENKIFLLVITFGLLFFVMGILFAYKIMLPFMLRFLIQVGKGSAIKSTMSVAKYLSFLFTIFIIFGIVFELPVVTVSLTRLGLLKVEWLKKARKVFIILIFFLSAFITPPDAVSQVMVAIPMIILYELSIGVCTILDRKKRKDSQDKDNTDE